MGATGWRPNVAPPCLGLIIEDEYSTLYIYGAESVTLITSFAKGEMSKTIYGATLIGTDTELGREMS